MSDKNSKNTLKRINEMLAKLHNTPVDLNQPINPPTSKAQELMNRIRQSTVEEEWHDPRTMRLDPNTHTKEQLESHFSLCEDIDLLASKLGPDEDEWDDL